MNINVFGDRIGKWHCISIFIYEVQIKLMSQSLAISFLLKCLPLLDIICFNLKWNYFLQKYFPLSSLISYKQCGTVEKLLSSLSAIFRNSGRNQVLEFRKKNLALINNCCKKMIKRKKYTSNCIYQSYLLFLRFMQMQLNPWILIFL